MRSVFGSEFRAELEAATELAVAAGEIARGYHGTALRVELKDGDQPVTVADREASHLITAGLRARFASDVVISEESADDRSRLSAPRVWYVDPIDGTADFIRGEDGFCVMIGLVVAGRPTVGVVHQPLSKLTYFAAPPIGAFRVVADGAPEPIRVSRQSTLSALRLVISVSHRDETIDRVKEALGATREENIGSVGLKLGLLAAGAADLYVTASDKCSSWDTAAPEAILAEAGGRLSDLSGAPLTYVAESVTHARGLLASNGAVHDAVVTALAPIFSL